MVQTCSRTPLQLSQSLTINKHLVLKFLSTNSSAFHPLSAETIAQEFRLSMEDTMALILEMLLDGQIRGMNCKWRYKGKMQYRQRYFI